MNNKLKEIRTLQNKSQAELARELGVSRQAINGFESGKFDPSLAMAFKISQLLSVAIEDIFLYEAQALISVTTHRVPKYFGRERFVKKAIKVIKFAGNEAACHQVSLVQPKHLFRGLLADPSMTSARLLYANGVTHTVSTDDHSFEFRGEPKLSPKSKEILMRALTLVQEHGKKSIGTEHLLLGWVELAHVNPDMTQVLQNYGVDLKSLVTQLRAIV